MTETGTQYKLKRHKIRKTGLDMFAIYVNTDTDIFLHV